MLTAEPERACSSAAVDCCACGASLLRRDNLQPAPASPSFRCWSGASSQWRRRVRRPPWGLDVHGGVCSRAEQLAARLGCPEAAAAFTAPLKVLRALAGYLRAAACWLEGWPSRLQAPNSWGRLCRKSEPAARLCGGSSAVPSTNRLAAAALACRQEQGGQGRQGRQEEPIQEDPQAALQRGLPPPEDPCAQPGPQVPSHQVQMRGRQHLAPSCSAQHSCCSVSFHAVFCVPQECYKMWLKRAEGTAGAEVAADAPVCCPRRLQRAQPAAPG